MLGELADESGDEALEDEEDPPELELEADEADEAEEAEESPVVPLEDEEDPPELELEADEAEESPVVPLEGEDGDESSEESPLVPLRRRAAVAGPAKIARAASTATRSGRISHCGVLG